MHFPRSVFGSYISRSESLHDTFWLYGGGRECLHITLKSTTDVLVLVCSTMVWSKWLEDIGNISIYIVLCLTDNCGNVALYSHWLLSKQ